MSEKPGLIFDDARPIDWIMSPDRTIEYFVGRRCTAIVAYKEHGQCDFVPYYAVYQDDNIVARVPGHLVAAGYQP